MMAASHDRHIERAAMGPKDETHFWRERRYGDLECLRARFVKHRYAPHIHDTYAIGVITQGVEVFRYRGETHYAKAGSLAFVNPGEVHDGEPEGPEGFAYRMYYPTMDLMRDLVRDIYGRESGVPWFRNAVINDPEMVDAARNLHLLMETLTGAMERDDAFVRTFAGLILRHADLRRELPAIGRESMAVTRVRDFMEDRYEDDISLDDLAAVSGLSRYHLIRVFNRETGMTPHAYLTNRRIMAARNLLRNGEPIAETAVSCGFCDQSHLTRTFKAITGVTPAQYLRATSA